MDWKILKNFQKEGGGYRNSEVLVILYVVFVATQFSFSSDTFSLNNNIILKDVAIMKSDILKH